MTITNSEYAAYPVNGTYAMQQAWRLFFDKDNLKKDESYLIEKNYPKECLIMCGRRLVAVGILSPNDLTSEQDSYIEQKFGELIELAFNNPKKMVVASCVIIGGLTAAATAAVFFCSIAVISVSVIALAIITTLGITMLLS